MAVPYTFAGATSSIPLSQLDANFATAFTLGNTAIQLGNTVTTLNNMTLANVTISSGNVTITNVSVTTANVTTGNVTTLTSTNATLTNMSSGNVTITGGTINGTTLGATTAASANVTTLTTSSTVTLNSGTAIGVAYLNGSKVLTTGSALTFDGNKLAVQASSATANRIDLFNDTGNATLRVGYDTSNNLTITRNAGDANIYLNATQSGAAQIWQLAGSEQMRLTSTGLGIGTSSPSYRLDVQAATAVAQVKSTTGTNAAYYVANNTGGDFYIGRENSAGTTFGTAAYSAVLWSAGAYPMAFFTNGTERMRLDSSGNLGLGVTPSAHAPSSFGGPIFQVSLAGLMGSTTDNILAHNTYYATGAYRYIASSTAATRFDQTGGAFRWLTAPSGTAGNTISFSQVMTLDASGNLALGITSTSFKAEIRQSASTGNGSKFVMTAPDTGNTSLYLSAYDSAFGGSVIQSSYEVGGGSFKPLIFATGNTERARITSGGDLLVGTSSGQVASTVVAYRASAATSCVGAWSAATSGDNLFIDFYTEATATQRGSIDYNRAGGLTRYNTTSDYRAKNIIGPVQNTGAVIDALKIYEGVMKGATQSRPMMIAHEAQAVVPFCVSGAKDETNEDGTPKYQQMDHASLVPLLIAEIQSLRARVAALEAA